MTKRTFALAAVLVLALAAGALALQHFHRAVPLPEASARCYFSPSGGCTEAIVSELEKARKSIHVQAYLFTSAPIAKALKDAHDRGVRVQVLLDKSNKSEKYSVADFLVHAGIETRIDSGKGIAHNKVTIVDEQVVLTGSFNFTKAAEESNEENLLVCDSSALAARYLENWRKQAAKCAPYAGK
ncbi:MAG TPA: phospholipase D family protein [Planctomycetota bacterium]|nr:phospholipase D family protein [Planctomycetota bacterium]